MKRLLLNRWVGRPLYLPLHLSLHKLLLVTALSFLIGSSANTAIASECVEADVRQLIDHIINQQPDTADDLLASIRQNYPAYSLANFYQASIDWSRQQFSASASQRKLARKKMLKAIEDLEARLEAQKNMDNRFALGVAQGLAARMFIFDEQYLKAYRLGKAAKEHIATVFVAEPERDDARLFIGLFEYYTSTVPDEFSWFSRLINWNGNREIGVRQLEFAVKHSPVFAHEAARALLMEVNWQLPAVCEYLPLAELLASKNIRNPYFSLTLQGVYLRCGQPEKALVYNEKLATSAGLLAEIQLANQKARLRAWGQQGDVETIKLSGLGPLMPAALKADEYSYQFALANAYDVLEMRDKAQRIYLKLSQTPSLPEAIVNMAKIRQRFAYQPPKRIVASKPLSIASACR